MKLKNKRVLVTGACGFIGSHPVESLAEVRKNKRNILITGGAGYIGSVLVGKLLANGINTVVIDNLTYGGESLLRYFGSPNFKFFLQDINNTKKIKSIINDNRIDTIIHLAAIVGDPACAKQPELARKVNYKASVDLLDLSIENNVKRFIFASTCSNYGKMAEQSYVDERSLLSPISLYAELKVKFEKYLLQCKAGKGFFPTSLRFSTAYGFSPRMRFDLTVNEFAKEAVLGRELIVFGEQFWRPYCHVEDLSRGCLCVLCADRELVEREVFNVGDTGENYQKQTIVNLIKQRIPGMAVRFIHKKDDPRDYRVNFEKIQKRLGFKIIRTIQTGIDEVIALLRSGLIRNPDADFFKNS